MKVTNDVIALIANRFRDPSKPKINQSQLAEHVGLGKAWVSKLMTGKLQTLSDTQLEQIEAFLGIRLSAYSEKSKIPAAAIEIARKMQDHEPVARIVGALLELNICNKPPGTRWIAPADMTKVGSQIIQIVTANPGKPGKVASLVLQLLA